jgi:phage shock protein A
LRAGGPCGPSEASALAEAEVTLRRLRARQAEEAAAAVALQTLDGAAPAGISERMEAAGFGPRTRPSVADVLARLRERAAAGPQPSPEFTHDEENRS